ncbi:putative metallocarboxypeptidase ECM14 [Lasiodiplodia hormozganensis]|uniref:Inactive metallocarboxypeptidase ECM14 n=1 Tax=Lasiodiplodia hormozganensis TaxID=869390 RepID=A0AA39YXN9_9PEZI|nr:putative metallocarboxypeptidase ECM14 [Lasiodiplodia hormozganensis]
MRVHVFEQAALLFLCAPALTAAGPSRFDQCCTSPLNQPDSRPSWRKLSDRVLTVLWGPPNTPSAHGAAGLDANARGGRVAPPGKLLARYGDDMVLRFNVSTEYEARKLADAANTLFLDVWEFNENWVDIRVAKDVVPSLLGLLPASLQDAHAPLMRDHDLAQAIFDSYPATNPDSIPSREPFSHSLRSSQNAQTNLFFRDYQPLSVIMPWLRLMESLFTTHARLINIGISYEGRDIPALKVGVHPTNRDQDSGPRKTILVTGGSHAREWISVSTVNYLAYSMITSYGKSATTTALLEAFDWVFVPTLNPDGYVYTWETDRLWRKNRQMTSLRFCQGIDLDRSYDFHWDGEFTRNNPCSESYAGDEPFEGVEAKRFADWAKNETDQNNVQFVAFLDLHSYSEQILYPYSYSCADQPPTLEDLEEVALGLAKAIRVSKGGHSYKATSACEGNVAYTGKNKDRKTYLPRMETGGGSALDYFYHQLGIKYSYQIKLRDTGSYGFLLPKQNIVPTGKEVLGSIYYLGHYLLGDIGLMEEDEETSLTSEGTVTTQPSVQTVTLDEESEEEELEVEILDDFTDDDATEWELRRRRRR